MITPMPYTLLAVLAATAALVVPRMPSAVAVPLRIVASAAVALSYARVCLAGIAAGGVSGLRLARRAPRAA